MNKQDKVINKIKQNHQNKLDRKNYSSFLSQELDEESKFSKENYLKQKEDLKMSVQLHKEKLYKAKKRKYNIEKKIAQKLNLEKFERNKQIEKENKKKHDYIKNIHKKQTRERS